MYDFKVLDLTALSVVTLLGVLGTGFDARAQSTSGGTVERNTSLQLEEVVVTARKREESIQDIPEAVSAFSDSDIGNIGITSIKDVVDLTPNIILQPSFRIGVVNLSARGIATPQQGDSPVVLNFDGVQAPAQDFINQDLFDIERIEVLKGPQGALYGAGAIAGAINIVTKRPVNEFEGFAKVTLSNGDAHRLVAGVSGPLVDNKVYYRLAAVDRRRDGYIDNDVLNTEVDFLDEQVLRAALYWDMDRTNVDFRAALTETVAGASFYESLPFRNGDSVLGGDTRLQTFRNHSNLATEEERDIATVSLKIEHELAAGVITSITGYNNSEQSDFGDLDFQPIDLLIQDVRFDVEVFNQEFRFASDEDQIFRWVGGLFYQERDIFNQVLVLLDLDAPGREVQPTTLDQSRYSYNSLADGGNLLTDGRDSTDSRAWGLFFSSNFDLTDTLTLTAAARYDKVDVDTVYAGEDPELIAAGGGRGSKFFSKLQPKINLAYNLNGETLIYVDIARGFRAGAPNPTAGFAGGLPRFIKPEVADSLEIGIKTTFLDNRVLLNAAVFHTDISNRHHYFFGANLQSMTTFNEAEVEGIELDLIALLAPGLQFSASYGTLSTEIVDMDGSGTNRGNRLPDTPNITFNTALSYERPLFNDVSFYSRIGYKRLGKIYFDTENFISTEASREFVDVRIGLQSERWDLIAFIDNAGDERTYTNYAESGGQGNYIPNLPKIYGLETAYRF